MKIIVHDYAGHPFQLDLSKKLAELGYSVVHYYSTSSGGPKAGFESDNNELTVKNIDIGKVEKLNFLKRALQENYYGKKVIQELKNDKPDIIISANTPIFAQRQIYKWAKKNNVKFIFWLQDIISIAARTILEKKNKVLGSTIYYLLNTIERDILRGSDFVITIAKDFNEIIFSWGVSKEKVRTIPNWAPIEEIPVLPKKNKFSQKYELTDSFNIVYSGTMGFKHNPELVYGTAKLLQDIENIKIVVISEGQGADYLKEKQKEEFLKNLIILPFQKWEVFPEVLASSDILLTLLEKDAGVFSVPSKVWSGFCAQRVSLLVVPKNNLAAKIVLTINAGVVIDSYQEKDIAKKIKELMENPMLMKEMSANARRYAEENFRIEKIANKFIKIIENVS